MRLLAKVRGAGMTRGLWNVGDQLISSASNFLVGFAVARSVSEVDFGSFSIAFAVFSVAIGFFRALATAPVGMRFAASDDAEFHRVTRASTGLVTVGGVLLGVGLVVLGAVGPFPGVLDQSLIALGVVIAGLLLQDAWRQILFARLRPAAACVLDGAWAVLQLVGIGALYLSGVTWVPAYVVAWGGSALLASFVGLAQMRVRPRVTEGPGWLREQSSLTRYLVPEYVLLQSGAQIAVIVGAALAGTAAAGSLRGANMLTVPATIMSTGLMTFAVPELVRRRDRMQSRHWGLAVALVSGLVLVTGLLWGVVVLLLPDVAGEWVLGDTWAGTKSVLVAIIVGQAGAALSVGPAAVLYATEGAKVTIRLHAVYAVLLIGLSTVGAFQWGAVGTAWGMASAFWLTAPWWFVAVRRHLRSIQLSPRPPRAPASTLG